MSAIPGHPENYTGKYGHRYHQSFFHPLPPDDYIFSTLILLCLLNNLVLQQAALRFRAGKQYQYQVIYGLFAMTFYGVKATERSDEPGILRERVFIGQFTRKGLPP